jgi:hypothetical protein
MRVLGHCDPPSVPKSEPLSFLYATISDYLFMKTQVSLKKLWHDPVWSKVISGGILAIVGLLFAYLLDKQQPTDKLWIQEPTPNSPISNLRPTWPPIAHDALKNLTYQIDDEHITLQNGEREFDPQVGDQLHEKALFAYLVDHAFGDLDGDGNSDAVAVLQVSGRGTGKYYYLSVVYNDRGTAKVAGRAFDLGDRVHFRSLAVVDGKIQAELLMHGLDDGLCCPSVLRSLEFVVRNRALVCTTLPCPDG